MLYVWCFKLMVNEEQIYFQNRGIPSSRLTLEYTPICCAELLRFLRSFLGKYYFAIAITAGEQLVIFFK